MILNNRQDIYRLIRMQPLFQRDLYVENYDEIAGDNFLKLLEENGFSWGDDEKDIEFSDEDFWECFRDAEKPVAE